MVLLTSEKSPAKSNRTEKNETGYLGEMVSVLVLLNIFMHHRVDYDQSLFRWVSLGLEY